jgi:hypothetical protein
VKLLSLSASPLLALSLALGCGRKPAGERLAHTYCGACHAFPDPALLDKKTWQTGVLPQMAPRLGIFEKTLYNERYQNPDMKVLNVTVPDDDWRKIVGYYVGNAPDSLPPQSFPTAPAVDSGPFAVGAFAPRLASSGIITLLKADSVHQRIFVGEGGTNLLRVFDWSRHLLASITLGSPPTDVIADRGRVRILESGILDPNDLPRGSVVEFDDSLRTSRVLIDSLYRPVAITRVAPDQYVICEFGNNVGRLALYTLEGTRYRRQVLDASPGAIHVELHDLTGDGAPDIVALFAQGDERIVVFENDGKGNFAARQRILARFPPVYGSMFFTMRDMNGDGKLDIVYVNGDNFDYSRILKPYHGVRILENDGRNNFRERYFYPIYGAAQAVVGDFNGDGRPDIMATSNFADLQRHAERGITYLENGGGYRFRASAFAAAAGNQWNVMTLADLNGDGRPDVIVAAMNLATIARVQQRFTPNPAEPGRDALLLFATRR